MIINIRKLLLYFSLGTIIISLYPQVTKATNITVNSMVSLQTALLGSSDTIYISPSASPYTITVSFAIARNVCIIGQPSGGLEVIIKLTGNFRHFSYNGAYNLELKDLVLIGPNANYTAGTFTPVTPTTNGGGVFAQNGNLKITGCKIAGCQSPANGGAIEANTNPLVVDDYSVFQYNNSRGHGGTIFTDVPLILENVTIRNSKAGFDFVSQTVSLFGNGGAINAGNGCTLKGDIVFENNEAYSNGGALFKAAAGNFDLTGLTLFVLKNNLTYTGDGGGICTYATLTLDNSTGIMTVSPNTAGRGGGSVSANTTLILKDLAFTNNKAGYNPVTAAVSNPGAGGAVIAGGSLFLQGNITFDGNKAYGDGGAIYKNATGVLDVSGISSLTIQNNATYTGQGGGICTYVALILDNTSNNLVLSPNTAGMNGGTIAAIAPLTLKNTTFSNCKAGYDPNTSTVSLAGSGGAVAAHNALTLEGNVVFQDNQAYTDGGAVFKGTAGNFDVTGITNLTIKDNATYTGQGGGICTYAALTLDNTSNNLVLFPNTAGLNGGAIAAIVSLTLKNTTFSNCKAGYNPNTSTVSLAGSGGAVVAHNALTLEGNVVFQNNQAYTDGGAVFKGAPGNFDVTGITNLTIKDNATYTGRGGGICTHAALTLDNTSNNLVLSPNTAGSHGGAIAAIAPLVLKNTTISDCKAGYNPNTATLSQAGQGGAIYANNQITCYGNITFENNIANNDGGAICLIPPLANLDAATNITTFIVKDNKAKSLRGGAIAAFGTGLTVINISNAIFEGNTSQHDGGAIYAYGRLSLSHSTFHNNTSSNNGGGVYKDGSPSFPLDIRKCTFSNNSAVNGGGVFTAESLGSNTISNSTFSQNNATANGGGFFSSAVNASVAMALNTFNGNTSASGVTAIYFAGATNKILNGCIVYGNGTGTELLNPGQSDYNIIRGISLTGTANANIPAGNGTNIFAVASGDLATLANNGGKTRTLAIKKYGPAYNYIPMNVIQSWEAAFGGAGSLASDQCDSLRNGCMADVGAFEVQDEDIPVVTLKNNIPVCFGSLLNVDTLIISATFMNDTIYSSDNLYTDTLSMPITVTTQNRIYVQFTTTSNCKLDTFIDLTINPLPVVTITTVDSSICLNSSVTMVANVTGGMWSNKYPAIASINASTGVITALSVGTDTIYYSYTNSSGCSAYDTTTLTVLPLPVVTITTVDSSVCLNGSVTMIANVTGGIWSNKYSGIASINASTGVITIFSAGTDTIYYTYTNSSGCSASDTTAFTVLPLPVVTITNTNPSVCLNDSVTMTVNVSGGTWSNKYPGIASINASTGVITTFSAGTDTIYYTYTNGLGCSASDTAVLTVFPLPVVTITSVNPSLCLNSGDITLTANVTGGVWSSSNPLVVIVNAGTGAASPVSAGSTQISYTYVNSNGCCATDSAQVTVNGFPSVSFSYQQLLPPEPSYTVQFSGQSSDSIISWSWDFGDGNTGISRNPKHTYSSSGIYTVDLSVVSLNGCSNSDMVVIDLSENIDAQFDVNAQSQCLFNNVFVFTNKSTISGVDAMPVSWYWNFGDGSVSQLKNPQHTYDTAGTYTVELIATTKHGIRDTSEIIVFVSLPPKIDPVSDQTYCNNVSVPAYSFTGNLSNAIYKWKWIGGDKLENLPLSGQNIFPAFQASNQTDTTQTGIYQAWAESNDSLKCSGDSVIFTRSVFPSPQIMLSADVLPACPYEEKVIFTYTTDLLLPVEYRIEFDQHAKNNGFYDIPDTTLSDGKIVIPLPSGITPGLYKGTLYTAIAGCTDSITYPITIPVMIASPVITGQPHDVAFCSGDTELYLEVKTLQGNMESYQWYKNGIKIDGAIHSKYQILAPSNEDAGIYYVEITNKCMTVRSDSAKIVRNPFDILTKWNSTVLFVSNVDAQNNLYGYVRYQWYLDEHEIKGAVYQYYEIPEGESGYYKVRAYRPDNSMDESCASFHTRGGNALKFRIYPNPVAHLGNIRIEIEMPQGEKTEFRVELFNLLGVRILSQEIHENSVQLPIHAQPGTYIVRITNSNGVNTTKKLIVSQ